MTTLTKTEGEKAPTGPDSFLSVRDLRVRFSTEDGIVKAVDVEGCPSTSSAARPWASWASRAPASP